MANNEDERVAAEIFSNTSGFLITASLAMIAVEGALFAFVLGNRIVGYGYFIISSLAFGSFILSIIFGGLGNTKIATSLARGTWSPPVGGSRFSKQAGFAYLGLFLFILSTFLSGKPSETEIQKSLVSLSKQVGQLQFMQESMQTTLKELDKSTKDLAQQQQQQEQRNKNHFEQIEIRIKELEKKAKYIAPKELPKKPN